jgi:dolichyl-phosphate mannosyltransferase polypeptide 3
MTRATEAFTAGAIAIIIYFILFFGFVPLPEIVQDKIVPVVSILLMKTIFSYF